MSDSGASRLAFGDIVAHVERPTEISRVERVEGDMVVVTVLTCGRPMPYRAPATSFRLVQDRFPFPA